MTREFEKVEMLRVAVSERYFLNMLMPARFTSLKHISYSGKGPESPGDLRCLLENCGKTVETLTVLSRQTLTIGGYSIFFSPVALLCLCIVPILT